MVALRDEGWTSFPEARKLGFLKTKCVFRSALEEARVKAVGNSLAPDFRNRSPTVAESRGAEVKPSSRSRFYTDHRLSSVVRIIYMI